MINLEIHMKDYRWKGIGRKRKSRISLMKAFILKAILNLDSTKILIQILRDSSNLRRLCGWERSGEVPSEATFSRAFNEFSEGELTQSLHAALAKIHGDAKLVGHVSRDSTAVEGREKPAKKESKNEENSQVERKRGRPKKGETPPPKPPTRLDLQPFRSLDENLHDLPVLCDIGTKCNSKGHKTSWNGYKLHLDVADGDIPISAILTSATVHDSQVAIPLSQMTAGRVNHLYELMDSAYDAIQIKEFSKSQGHIPIIDQNPRRGERIPMEPAVKRRYCERTSAERVNSNLKDNYGGKKIRVKGDKKVMTHLMLGIIVIAASQMFRMLL